MPRSWHFRKIFRKLIIPPELGYGKTGNRMYNVPPDAMLIFEIEMVAVKKEIKEYGGPGSGSGGGGGGGGDNREREISAITRSLKALAKELNIPVVALSQLSRAPEQRRGRQIGRPQLSDLRESGAIEQDADVVIFIYREDLYKKPEDLENEQGVAEIIIAKQRNGPTGVIKLAFIAKWTRFENLAFDRE